MSPSRVVRALGHAARSEAAPVAAPLRAEPALRAHHDARHAVVARIAARHHRRQPDSGHGHGDASPKGLLLTSIRSRRRPICRVGAPRSGDLFQVDDSPVTPAPAAPPDHVHAPPPAPGGPGDLVPHSTMRKRIAEHMVLSKLRTAPHVTTVFEADMSAVSAHRAAHKDEFARRGINLTFTAYFVAAIAQALRRHPHVNSQWRDDGLLLKPEINVGMAVALDDGLIVPVIKRADELSLAGLARLVNDLAQRARSNTLAPDEVQGGTFTLTNHGVAGSLFATPIINQPQTGILGVGAIKKRVVVLDNDAIAVRPMVYLSFTFDHRVLDGASADWFVAEIVKLLEGWE